jgi:CubicO group peptidase (beta-lactamase class C family)
MITLLAFWLLQTLKVHSQVEFPRQLDNLIGSYVERRHFSGVVAIAGGDSTTYLKSFGMADRDSGVENTPETRMNISSVGMTFTAVLVMQLVEEGKLDLQSPIQKYLPGSIPNSKKITIHHLLTHTSGLTSYMLHPKYDERKAGLQSLDDVMSLIKDMPLAFDTPGVRFEYSTSGFIVLGKLIERVTGKSYATCVKERILEPLGMTNTTFNRLPSVKPPAEAYAYYVFSEQAYVKGGSDEYPAFSDGGAFSNARDLIRFAQALLSDKLMKRSTRDKMFASYADAGQGARCGYGWFVEENYIGKRVVGNTGGRHGYSCDIRILPKERSIVLVLANVRIAARDMTKNLLNMLLAQKGYVPRRTATDFLFSDMETSGVDTVLANLAKVLEGHDLQMPETPWMLTELSDAFAQLKRYDEALRIQFENARLFPSSPMPQSTIAEIYILKGMKNDAIKHFRKALAIDPTDGYAKLRLKALK